MGKPDSNMPEPFILLAIVAIMFMDMKWRF